MTSTDLSPVCPGVLVRELLDALEPGPRRIARQALGISIGQLSDRVRGKGRMTGQLALRLGALFGTHPEFWLQLQNTYDLHRARLEQGSEPLPAAVCEANTLLTRVEALARERIETARTVSAVLRGLAGPTDAKATIGSVS